MGIESETSDPNRLARAAARSSSAVRGFGGPILCVCACWPGLCGRVVLVAVRDGPVGGVTLSAGPFPLAFVVVDGVGGGTEPVDRVARGPAGGG
jgi:hypothetical protein